MRRLNIAAVLLLACFLAGSNLARAGGPNSGSKVQKLDADALARLIDGHIEKRLKAGQIPSSPRTDDAEFLRRAYLDIHGVIPTVDQARGFLDKSAPDRRARLIDELLGTPRYAAHFADLWHNHLYPPNANQRIKPEAMARWLEHGFQTKSWDRIAHDLITATGSQEENGAVTCNSGCRPSKKCNDVQIEWLEKECEAERWKKNTSNAAARCRRECFKRETRPLTRQTFPKWV